MVGKVVVAVRVAAAAVEAGAQEEGVVAARLLAVQATRAELAAQAAQ